MPNAHAQGGGAIAFFFRFSGVVRVSAESQNSIEERTHANGCMYSGCNKIGGALQRELV